MNRLWITIVIASIAVIFVVWAAPTQHYQARGILLPAKNLRTPISPASVIRLQNRPMGSKILGYIHIERRYPANNQQAQQQIWQLAQNLAAKVGANGVIINLLQIANVSKGHYIYLFQATAIYRVKK